uniref:Major facilitator superfamily (MFS) profile domain-containing protein n=1 Tax=Clastoptera arizonana TaxID=38151 RepID=A0A1B6E0X0_9HEMI
MEPSPIRGGKEDNLDNNISIIKSADREKLVLNVQPLKDYKIRVADVYPQIIASCISLSFVIQAGISMGFSAILLPQLTDPDENFIVTTNEASWIASLVAIGTPVGSLICGPLMDFFGRKKFSLICCVPNIIAWMLIVLTPNSVWMLYIGRLLGGLSGGMSTVTGVYVTEIAHQQYRPMLLGLNSVFVSFGIFLTTVLGTYFHWRTVSVCCACFMLLTFFLTLFINPESPVWLVKFNQNNYQCIEQAKKELSWLNPNKEVFMSEWEKLISYQCGADIQKNNNRKCCHNLNETLTAFSNASALKPMIILIVLFLLQQLSGPYPIIFYAVQLFQSMESTLNEYTALEILGTLRLLMSIVSLLLSGVFGRRTLLIFSSICMVLSSLATAMISSQHFTRLANVTTQNISNHITSTHLNASLSMSATNINTNLTLPSWVGVLCIILFVGGSSIGVLTLPWCLTGELLPTPLRGVGSGVLVSYAYILLFLVVKYFPCALLYLKVSGLFYSFSLISFILAVFIYFFLPETLGKSLEDIENYFLKQKR